MKNIAIILAGGTGSRIGEALPKQFLEVAGMPVIAYSIDVFEKHAGIDEIAVVVHSSYREVWNDIAKKHQWKKVSKVLEGGHQRSASTLSALQAYSHLDEANMLFHDAVRPFVSSRMIDDTLRALKHYAAVTVAAAVTDTVLQTDIVQQTIAQIPSRSLLRRTQTPQGFKLSLIRKAYALATTDPDFAVTDDCGVVHKYLPEIEIGLVVGDEKNLKITWPQDLQLMEILLDKPRKVVITYGTFDLFYYGHIEILHRAKALGTKLFVGLSTDEFNEIKGKICVHPYAKRKEILEATRYVDFVFPEMNWEQKLDDVKKYHADIFVMGDDWTGKFDFLKPFCEVIYLPRTENISTTLLKKISKKQ